MTTQEVADRLVELCRQGEFVQAVQELYSDDIVSIEPEGSPMGTVRGIPAIMQKGEQHAHSIQFFKRFVCSSYLVN